MRQTSPTLKPPYARYEDVPLGAWCHMVDPDTKSVCIVKIKSKVEYILPTLGNITAVVDPNGPDEVEVLTPRGILYVRFSRLHPL